MTELEWYAEASNRLNYNPETGIFSWRGAQKNGPKTIDGMPGTTVSGKRSIGIHFNGKTKLFSGARLAWYIVHKDIPASDIIHLNGNGLDDRINNLKPKTKGNLIVREKRVFCVKSKTKPTDIEFYEYAKTLVEYDSETGKFIDTKTGLTWKYSNINGYYKIAFRMLGYSKQIPAHRLAWYIVYKEIPVHTIDHINHIKTDNWISNLRDVPQSINAKNKRRSKKNTSGVCGVSFIKKSNRWRARIHANYKDVFIQYFDTKEEAINAISLEKKKPEYSKHGFTETHGT